MNATRSELPDNISVIACDDCQATTIAVLRETKDGGLSLAAWCPFCEKDVTECDGDQLQYMASTSNYIN